MQDEDATAEYFDLLLNRDGCVWYVWGALRLCEQKRKRGHAINHDVLKAQREDS